MLNLSKLYFLFIYFQSLNPSQYVVDGYIL